MLRMRKTEPRKSETRQRIVDAADSLFRQYGIDGVGVDAIMHAAGLTHGGFYGHFASKEALVAEVSAAALARSAARWERIADQRKPAEALLRIVSTYLDPTHLAAVESGCVLPTLGPEVARRPEARAGMASSVRAMLAALERCMPDAPQEKAKVALSAMVGAVVLARLADHPAMAEEFLDAVKDALLRDQEGHVPVADSSDGE
jgi:TetR/AcrR family transcriptional regulator, transcriptional repressor for nem operon